MPRISALPSLTTADSSDQLAIVDTSASVTKKITRSDLLKGPFPNNSVTTAAITDSSVTGAKIAKETWSTWTPTFANLSIGNGTIIARYQRINGMVAFEIGFVFGSTSSITGAITFTLPPGLNARSVSNTNTSGLGSLYIEDAGLAGYSGIIRLESTTSAGLFRQGVSGENVSIVGITASAPFAWATGDWARGYGIYEAA